MLAAKKYRKDGQIFRITFDEFDIIDTISMRIENNEWKVLTTKNKYAKFFLNNHDSVVAGSSFKNAERMY
jgi:hypothetical protein